MRSLSAVSCVSEYHVEIKIPESFCSKKFSAILSTIIVRDKSLPILDRSLTIMGKSEFNSRFIVCYLYRRCLMRVRVGSSWSITQSAYSCIPAVKITISYSLESSCRNRLQKGRIRKNESSGSS